MPNNNTSTSDSNALCSHVESLRFVPFVIIVFGFTGNFFICFAFASYERIRKVNNYFLCNLAVSNLVHIFQLCLYEARESIVTTLTKDAFDFGMRMIETFSGTANIATVCVITYDRHYSVTKPLLYTANITTRKAVLFIVCIWLYAAALAVLQLLSLLSDDVYKYGYVPLMAFCNGVVPFVITVYSYTIIFLVISRLARHNPHQSYSQSDNSTTNLVANDIRIAHHLLVLVGPPVLYWIVYYSVAVPEVYCRRCLTKSCLANWFISMTASFLTTVDPIVYIFLTKDFRKIIFGWLKRRNGPFPGETFPLSMLTEPTTSQELPASRSEN